MGKSRDGERGGRAIEPLNPHTSLTFFGIFTFFRIIKKVRVFLVKKIIIIIDIITVQFISRFVSPNTPVSLYM